MYSLARHRLGSRRRGAPFAAGGIPMRRLHGVKLEVSCVCSEQKSDHVRPLSGVSVGLGATQLLPESRHFDLKYQAVRATHMYRSSLDTV